MSILTQMFNQMTEHCNGRIRVYSNLWIFADQVPQGMKPQEVGGRVLRIMDANGNALVSIRRRGVDCPCPSVGAPYPKSAQREEWIVPYVVCSNCEYRRKPRRGIRYPHCAWAQQKRGGAAGAAREMLGMMGKATTEAERLIQGR